MRTFSPSSTRIPGSRLLIALLARKYISTCITASTSLGATAALRSACYSAPPALNYPKHWHCPSESGRSLTSPLPFQSTTSWVRTEHGWERSPINTIVMIAHKLLSSVLLLSEQHNNKTTPLRVLHLVEVTVDNDLIVPVMRVQGIGCAQA
jgi:hypothetical protein